MAVVKPLQGHTSQETAYMVDDYPYGRKLRCRIRFWLETDPKKGVRFCHQTEHPTTKVWNAPKKGTYNFLVGAMYLDEQGHCTHESIGVYDEAARVLAFAHELGMTLDDAQRARLVVWCVKKASLTHKLATGEAAFMINGVAQKDTAEESARKLAESKVWEECVHLLRAQTIPADFPVRPLVTSEDFAKAGEVVRCGGCGRAWDNSISTSYTPAPSARCPFEYFHRPTKEEL